MNMLKTASHSIAKMSCGKGQKPLKVKRFFSKQKQKQNESYKQTNRALL